jgi:3-oxoacyl-[acyl-carrier-protein] synthase II
MSRMSDNAPLVTGLGAVCALGVGVPAIWAALCEGRSGLREFTGFVHDGLRSTLGGWIVIDDAPASSQHAAVAHSRLEHFVALALQEALDDAGATDDPLARIGLVFGTSLGMSLVGPALQPPALDAMAGDVDNADLVALAARLKARFPQLSDVRMISTACSSGTHAIGLAADMVEFEGFDAVVAGGADALDRVKLLGHSALATLTTGLPRPYSTQRDGTLFGEGAAFVVLQPDRAGSQRVAYARCTGAGYSTDIGHLTAPDETGEGAARAVREALRMAGIEPHDVDHVNLHGSGTALNDGAEFTALRSVFGQRIADIPSTSIKAAVGHLMGAAGAIEAVATVLALSKGCVPPTLQTRADDIAFPIDLVTGSARTLSKPSHALSLSLGFGGANGALVFSAIENA